MSQYYKFAFITNEEEKQALFKAYLENHLTKWLGILQERLKKNSSHKYIAGDNSQSLILHSLQFLTALFLIKRTLFIKISQI